MGSSTFAEIKRAIRDGLFEKVVNMLNARRYYLSKKELDKIFYLGLQSGGILEWFLDNVDKYRTYLDDNHEAMYQFGLYGGEDEDDEKKVALDNESRKIRDTFFGWNPHDNIKLDVEGTLVKRSPTTPNQRDADTLDIVAKKGKPKFVMDILKNSPSSDLDLSSAFVTAWKSYVVGISKKASSRGNRMRIYSVDYGELIGTDILGFIKCIKREFKSSIPGALKCMKYIYSHMTEDEKKSAGGMLFSWIGGSREILMIKLNLLLRQKWIDYSWIKGLPPTNSGQITLLDDDILVEMRPLLRTVGGTLIFL